MADIRAEDLTQETKATLDGSEQFIMFDSTEGKRGTVADVGDYILQNGDADGQGNTVAEMIAEVPTGDEVSYTQTQTSGDELGTITINGTGKKIYGKSYANKQDKLVSGTNIKTVNNTSLLGSGNVAVQETLVSGTNIKTINGNDLLGSGNIVIQGGGGSIVVLSVESFSSLPQTISNAIITADMICLKAELGTPSAQTGNWTVTTASGSLTIAGTISGSTTATLYLARKEN